ncbi:MAG: hypothetical protein WDA27_14330 [Actinomycetota bacterium]
MRDPDCKACVATPLSPGEMSYQCPQCWGGRPAIVAVVERMGKIERRQRLLARAATVALNWIWKFRHDDSAKDFAELIERQWGEELKP